MKIPIIDEKMANINFDEHKYVFIGLDNITKYQYDITTNMVHESLIVQNIKLVAN
jgi:hypothetical protein